jgi:hypothetical protein
MLGLVPAGSERGDEIWLVPRGERPAVLRREFLEGPGEDSELKVMGEAYVYRCPGRGA